MLSFTIKQDQRCLIESSSHVSLSRCNHDQGQQWMVRSFDTGAVMVQLAEKQLWKIKDEDGLCLAMEGPKVRTASCTDDGTQKWYRFGDRLVDAETDKCMSQKGVYVTSSVCGDDKDQDFAITHGGGFSTQVNLEHGGGFAFEIKYDDRCMIPQIVGSIGDVMLKVCANNKSRKWFAFPG